MIGDSIEKDFQIPADILAVVQSNPQAWSSLQKFSPANIRIRVGFNEGSRNCPQEFKKRLDYFIVMTAKGRQFDFGGIDSIINLYCHLNFIYVFLYSSIAE